MFFQRIYRTYLSHIGSLSENQQLRNEFLRCNIYLQLLHDTNKRIKRLVSELQNADEKLHAMSMFLKGQQYWQELLQANQLPLLQQQLNVAQTPYQCVQLPILKFSIRYYFKKEDYLMVLMLMSKLKQRTSAIDAGLYQLELESLCHRRLNYNLSDILAYIAERCPPTAFYLKMLRMVFNKYEFSKQQHNTMFMKVFKIQIKNMSQAHKIQAIFYLLRFTLQKFYLGETNYGVEIIKEYQGNAEWFIDYGNYLVSKVSNNKKSNAIIEVLLVFVAVAYPKQCLWVIASLHCFSLSEQRGDTAEQLFARIANTIIEKLNGKGICLKARLKWMVGLVRLSTAGDKALLKELEEMAVPQEIPYVFDPQWEIVKLHSAKKTASGKSCPTQIVFQIKGRGKWSTAKVILKYCKDVPKASPIAYLMECNTANFFATIGILDAGVTYKIQHLSRSTTLVQYVPNIGNLQQIIDKYGVGVKECEEAMFKMKKHVARKPLGCFDVYQEEVKTNLSHVFLTSSSMDQWWEYRCNFIRTAAQWSFLGYVVGLGDRHVQNILVNDELKLIHIDFQYNLDHGLKLKVPQWVPFRLTRSLQQALGLLSHYGLFFAEMLHTAQSFQKEEPQIWKAMSYFQGFSDLNLTAALLARASFYGKNLVEGITLIIEQAADKKYLREMFDGWKPYL